MELQQGISYDLNQEKAGKTFKVIVDRKEEGQYIGRTEFDSPEVDNEVILETAEDKGYLRIGDFVNARVNSATEFDLSAIVNILICRSPRRSYGDKCLLKFFTDYTERKDQLKTILWIVPDAGEFQRADKSKGIIFQPGCFMPGAGKAIQQDKNFQSSFLPISTH